MFENPRRGRQARNFTTNVPKILDLKSSSEQVFSVGCPCDHLLLKTSFLVTITKTCLKMRARETATENVRSLMFHRLGKKSKQPQRGVATTSSPLSFVHVRQGVKIGSGFRCQHYPTVKAHSQHVLQI